MKVLKLLFQIVLIYSFLLIGELFVHIIHIKIPGSIIGLALLFICLKTKLIKLNWVEMGAKFLTAHLLLFFIPAAVGVVNYSYIFGLIGAKLLLVIFISTILVMISTGLVADFILHRKKVQDVYNRH